MNNTSLREEKNKINDIITKIIDNQTETDANDEFYIKKREPLEKLFLKETLTEEDFNEIRQLSITKGGFLNNVFRRNLWKKILCVKGNNNIYEFVILSEEQPENIINFDRIYKKVERLSSNYDRIIELDTNRSIINSILCSEHSNQITVIKEELNSIIKRNSAILEGRYHYYQGFHDLSLYIMLLFISNINIGSLIMQRISEFFLRDFLSEMKDNETPDFNMINSILSNLIEIKEPQAIKKLKSIVELIEPYFALSWILSWFTHNLTNISKIYRIMDFLLCSHPLAVFHMSAEIICEELKNLVNNCQSLNTTVYYETLQNINFNQLDFDTIIQRTEISFKKFPHNVVLKPFLKSITRKSYPLANRVSLQKEYIIFRSNTPILRHKQNRYYITAVGILIMSMIMYIITSNWLQPYPKLRIN